jgi:hypothetical protein
MFFCFIDSPFTTPFLEHKVGEIIYNYFVSKQIVSKQKSPAIVVLLAQKYVLESTPECLLLTTPAAVWRLAHSSYAVSTSTVPVCETETPVLCVLSLASAPLYHPDHKFRAETENLSACWPSSPAGCLPVASDSPHILSLRELAVRAICYLSHNTYRYISGIGAKKRANAVYEIYGNQMWYAGIQNRIV